MVAIRTEGGRAGPAQDDVVTAASKEDRDGQGIAVAERRIWEEDPLTVEAFPESKVHSPRSRSFFQHEGVVALVFLLPFWSCSSCSACGRSCRQ